MRTKFNTIKFQSGSAEASLVFKDGKLILELPPVTGSSTQAEAIIVVKRPFDEGARLTIRGENFYSTASALETTPYFSTGSDSGSAALSLINAINDYSIAVSSSYNISASLSGSNVNNVIGETIRLTTKDTGYHLNTHFIDKNINYITTTPFSSGSEVNESGSFVVEDVINNERILKADKDKFVWGKETTDRPNWQFSKDGDIKFAGAGVSSANASTFRLAEGNTFISNSLQSVVGAISASGFIKAANTFVGKFEGLGDRFTMGHSDLVRGESLLESFEAASSFAISQDGTGRTYINAGGGVASYQNLTFQQAGLTVAKFDQNRNFAISSYGTSNESYESPAKLYVDGDISGSGDLIVSGTIKSEKSIYITHHSYYDNDNSKNWIPMTPSGEHETTDWNDPNDSEYRIVAPFSGSLKKVVWTNQYTTIAHPGATKIGLCIWPSTSSIEVQSKDLQMTKPSSFVFTGSSFAPGDMLGISVHPAAAPRYVNLTCVWEYDTTTL